DRPEAAFPVVPSHEPRRVARHVVGAEALPSLDDDRAKTGAREIRRRDRAARTRADDDRVRLDVVSVSNLVDAVNHGELRILPSAPRSARTFSRSFGRSHSTTMPMCARTAG